MERTKTEVRDWLIAVRRRLERVENPALELQLMVGAVLDQPRSKILAHLDWELTAVQLDSLEEMLDRRLGGEPLPYILGRWEFFGLQFKVSPAVLIPRPETEFLVEHALSWLKKNPNRRNAADVGIGSAAISASLLSRVPDLKVTGIDSSFAALVVAKFNLAAQGVSTRAHLIQADLLSACRGPFDLVCANLPYIPTGTLSGLEVFKKEPALALDGGVDGLRLIERLLADAPRWLASAGFILLEIEAGQGETAPALARSYFPAADIRLSTDLAGFPRLISIESK